MKTKIQNKIKEIEKGIEDAKELHNKNTSEDRDLSITNWNLIILEEKLQAYKEVEEWFDDYENELKEKFCGCNETKRKFNMECYYCKSIKKLSEEDIQEQENPIHKNSCGKPILNDKGKHIIDCGDDLGGDNGEFAQCLECREKDFMPENSEGGK